MSYGYALNLTNGIFGATRGGGLVCDGSELSPDVQHRRMFVNALVRSGDYFITLATKLDGLSKDASASDEALALELEHIVSDLLYLQHSYEIQKKPGY